MGRLTCLSLLKVYTRPMGGWCIHTSGDNIQILKDKHNGKRKKEDNTYWTKQNGGNGQFIKN